MKECIIRNLADGPRDYPLSDGSSIYLGLKGRATGITRVLAENISGALRLAESKGLVLIEEITDTTDEEAAE